MNTTLKAVTHMVKRNHYKDIHQDQKEAHTGLLFVRNPDLSNPYFILICTGLLSCV